MQTRLNFIVSSSKMAFAKNLIHKVSHAKCKITRPSLMVFITVAGLISIAIYTNLLASSIYFSIFNYANSDSVLVSSKFHSPFNPITCPKCTSYSSENETLDPTLWIPDEPFVYYKSFGGLGNQLFQFACVYTIAKKNKLPLLVYVDSKQGSDVPGFKLSHGEFALHLFKVPLPRYETSRVKLISDYIEVASNDSRIQGLQDATILSQDYKVTNSILQLGGYCQSELFFHPYRDEIREFFRPKNPNTPSIIKWKNVIKRLNQSCDSVCVHVRRGDFSYTSNRLVNSSFYLTAMDDMRHRLQEIGKSPAFFFFSDDIKTVRTDFKQLLSIEVFNQLQWVSDSEKSLVEDLYLMSQCRHNIMSASSFGWWGAYLNDYPEKIVIAAHYKPELFKNDPFHAFFYRTVYYPMGWFIQNANFDNR